MTPDFDTQTQISFLNYINNSILKMMRENLQANNDIWIQCQIQELLSSTSDFAFRQVISEYFIFYVPGMKDKLINDIPFSLGRHTKLCIKLKNLSSEHSQILIFFNLTNTFWRRCLFNKCWVFFLYQNLFWILEV